VNWRLPDRRIDVRYVFTGDAGEQECVSLLSYLSPDERARVQQFLFLKDRIAFSIGRALLRKTLSRYVERAPEDWIFVRNAFGKPEIKPSSNLPDLRFNLSHSAGIVVAVFTRGRDIGVDVEHVEANVNWLDLARSHFAADEIKLLEKLSGEARRNAFYRLWALKEAYAKARGTGLSHPLADVSFTLDPPTISFSAGRSDDPNCWFLRQARITFAYFLAVAARRQTHEELDCRQQEIDLGRLLAPSPLE
jgi:4'-phosphopantetheinyl transferase